MGHESEMLPNLTAGSGIHFNRRGLITDVSEKRSCFGNVQKAYGFAGMVPLDRLHGRFGEIAHPESHDLAHGGMSLDIWASFCPPSASVLKMTKLERDLVRHKERLTLK